MYNWADLTDTFPYSFDLERMRADVARLNDTQWLGHYDPTQSREWTAALLVSRGGKLDGAEAQRPDWDYSVFKRTELARKLPYFNEVLDSLQCPQGRIRILKLAPGARINMHRDVGVEAASVLVNQVRLHVPIYTNDRVGFYVDGEQITMSAGRLYYVDFTKKHFVRNDGSETRLHLVMDLRVNEWLASAFPKLTPTQTLEKAVMGWALPKLWVIRSFWIFRLVPWVWKHYEGSFLQKIKKRFIMSNDSGT